MVCRCDLYSRYFMRRVFKCRVVSIQYNTIQTQYNTNSTQYNTIQFKCRAVTGPHHFCHQWWRKTWWRLPCSRKENTTLLHKHHPHLWNTTPLQTKTRNTKKHTKTNKVIMMPCSRKENTTPLPKSSSPLKNTKKYTKKTHLFQHHPYLHNTTNTQNATAQHKQKHWKFGISLPLAPQTCNLHQPWITSQPSPILGRRQCWVNLCYLSLFDFRQLLLHLTTDLAQRSITWKVQLMFYNCIKLHEIHNWPCTIGQFTEHQFRDYHFDFDFPLLCCAGIVCDCVLTSDW